MANVRSRNYPALSLGEAIQRARILYEKEGRAKVDAGSAVKAWGYGSLNGASLRVLSALRQYGLIDGSNEEIRLSERGLTLLLEPNTSPEHGAALEAALTSPSLFQDVLAEYPEGLPSDAALVSYLVRKQGLGEAAAKSVVESLRESIQLVGERNALSGDRGDINDVAYDPLPQSYGKPLQNKELSHDKDVAVWKTTLNLSPNSSLEFRINGEFPSADDLEYLPQFLELARLQLRKAVAKAAAESMTGSAAETTVGYAVE